MSRREERAIRCEAQDILAEAQAMLNGRALMRPWWYHQRLGWVTVNTLAHADWTTLSHAAEGGLCSRDWQWDSALKFLAAELLAAVGSLEDLGEVQRAQLIPLELGVLAGTPPAPRTPSDLVTLILPRIELAAGRRHPSTGPPTAAE
jgi:hypothetical protein